MGQPPSLLTSLTLVLASLVPLVAPPARAEAPGPSSADRATARTLAQEGYVALRDKDYATAVDRYKRALAIVRAPTLLRDLARAQVGLGKLVDAHENYSTIIREGVEDYAPAPWIAALADAKAEIGPLAKRLASMTITVSGPAHPKLTINGVPIPAAALGVKRPADPGQHELRAMADGYHTAKKRVTLKEGEAINIAFELEDAPPDAAPQDEEESGHVQVATLVDPAWRKPLTIGALALGGAGIALGGVTGILAMNKHNKLAESCPSGACGPSQKANRDGYYRLGTISTISFVAGGVSAAAGVVLLVVRPQILVQQQPNPTEPASSTRTAFKWSPFVGVDQVGVEGTF